MNKVFIYEETWENLLALLFFLFQNNIVPDQIKEKNSYESSLLDEEIDPVINKQISQQEWNRRIGKENMQLVKYVYKTENKNKELIIYYYLKNVLKYHEKTKYHRNLKCVNETLRLAKKVTHECHKVKGFLRFQETNANFLYAKMAFENDILDLLASHFQKRLSNEYWAIHDLKRQKIAFYTKKKVVIICERDILNLNIEASEKERKIENLWKTFFKTIAIKERENKKCQQSFMPKKYWQYMIEMEEEYEKSIKRK